MESGGGRRRRSHSGEGIDSLNLRDFLRVRDEEESRNSLAGLTLSAILESEKRAAPVNRTLLDIIRDDPNGGFKNNKKSWKVFRNKLRLRRAGAAWISTLPVPRSDVPVQNNNRVIISRRNSTSSVNTQNQIQPQMSTSPAINNGLVETNSVPNTAMLNAGTQRGGESPIEAVAVEAGGDSPVRMSLMALLAETDREMGLDGSAYMVDDDEILEMEAEEEEEKEEEDHGGGGGEGGGYNNCCVCMVRHKGAAFIPCGHTFCRLCSREVWVQRGNCPLCNGFILEILDIF
ncbi:uncharacterized protein LOC132269146 [Cornus florida]|uniref:uncharacterized protein LOC132269146 n=1 Tax=Cornus florida TaxID=4283 RepID=UPI00289D0E41|nr:uncharacterized protein LOC132269146 [Cornus florida]